MDLSALYDDSIDEPLKLRAFQAAINSGQIWQLEGSLGRTAMALIESGQCALGPNPSQDFWGAVVPSRHEVQPGSKGSKEYVEERGFCILE